ncbi:MAG: response regulator [Chitinispirillaceae bacterium]|nr:response regulator [Chitinispirillaceae bacterium]
MLLIAVYLLTAFFILTAVGFRTYYVGSRDLLCRIFFGCTLSWAFWHLIAFGVVTSDRAETVFGWSLLGVARFAAVPLSLHLLIGILWQDDAGRYRKLLLAVYLSAAVIIALQTFAVVNWLEPMRYHGGWILDYESRVVSIITSVWIAVVMMISQMLVLPKFFGARDGSSRKVTIAAMVTILSAVLGGAAGIFDLLSGRIPGIAIIGATVTAIGCTVVVYFRSFSPDNMVTVAEDVIAAIPDALLITATDGSIKRINPKAEEMTGYSSAIISGMNIDELFEPGFAEAMFEKAQRSDRNIRTQEARLRTASGKEIPVVINLSLVHKTRKRLPVAMVVSCHDSSFEKMALDEFRKTEQLEALGFLAGGIAHDFNNLLTSIVAYLSLARTTENVSDSLREKLDKVDSAARMVIDLNRQLATISKGSRPNREHCSLREILSSAIQLSLSGSTIECRSEIPEDLHSIAADTTQINQVFLNLLVNARQAMEKGGVIGVRCSNIKVDGAAWVEVEITDQGSGIPQDKLEEVFKPFFTTKKQGTGLGLSVVKSVVEKHGGVITVASRKGIGTTFTVRLPSYETAPEVVPTETETPVEELPTAPGKILVMDDEEGVRKALSLILTGKGHAVHAVEHGAAAITAYLKHRSEGEPFDLLLLDVTVRNGYGARQVIKRLREINPAVAAVVMSGYGENALMKEYGKFGFCDVIEKPFDSARIYRVVNKALARLRGGIA